MKCLIAENFCFNQRSTEFEVTSDTIEGDIIFIYSLQVPLPAQHVPPDRTAAQLVMEIAFYIIHVFMPFYSSYCKLR